MATDITDLQRLYGLARQIANEHGVDASTEQYDMFVLFVALDLLLDHRDAAAHGDRLGAH